MRVPRAGSLTRIGCVALVVVSILGSLVWHYSAPRTPTAEVHALVVPPGADDAEERHLAEITAKSQARSYVYLGQDARVLDAAAQRIGVDDGAQVAERVTLSVPVDTAIVSAVATGSTPEDATRTARAVLRAMADRVDMLQPDIRASERTRLDVLPAVTAPAEDPHLLVDLGTGLAVGLVLTVGFLWVLHVRTAPRGGASTARTPGDG